MIHVMYYDSSELKDVITRIRISEGRNMADLGGEIAQYSIV